jgi:hypothetical protein
LRKTTDTAVRPNVMRTNNLVFVVVDGTLLNTKKHIVDVAVKRLLFAWEICATRIWGGNKRAFAQ